ncbi:hypothetical protein GCM10018987_53970 [Streptomyces cremeus]
MSGNRITGHPVAVKTLFGGTLSPTSTESSPARTHLPENDMDPCPAQRKSPADRPCAAGGIR